jgi:cation:H+ antiporter
MAWLTFIFSAVVVVAAATKLAEYGDVIAVRARLGGMFVGTLLLAGATSLPELLTAINSLGVGEPDLAAGSMFGSGMFNMFMLAVLDLLFYKTRLLRRIAATHALTASLAILLTVLAVLFILVDIDLRVGWVGVDSLLIMALYVGGIRVLQGRGNPSAPVEKIAEPPNIPTLPRALLGFGAATLVLILITPWMVRSANQIAEITGISTGFIGATLLAITTSLPELVATIAAARIGAYDLAVGNLFGSNVFNMFAVGLTDVFYTSGRFLGAIDNSFAIAGLLAILLTCLGLIGNLARVERRLFFVEVDALLILVGYLLGMMLIYAQGIGV